MFGFGAASDSASEAGMFESRLNEFRNLLIKLYRQKTKLMAAREALRFQYVSGQKTKLNNLISAVLSQSYLDGNQRATAMFEVFTKDLLMGIPMVDMQGVEVPGFNRNPPIYYYTPHIGFLSPMKAILIQPAYPPENPDQRPIYQIAGAQNYNGKSLDAMVSDEFLRWFRLMINASGVHHEFSIPPSREWLLWFLMGSHSNIAQDLIQEYSYFVSLLAHEFPEYGGSLGEAIVETETMFRKLMVDTLTIMALQVEIDGVEKDLAFFVAEFSSYAASIGLNVSDILRDIQAAADAADLPPPVIEPEAVLAPPPPPTKSKWPWLVAAAAGVMFLNREK